MAKYGKWIGGGLGWALGGPIGALFGFFLGSVFDDTTEIQTHTTTRTRTRSATGRGDFSASLLVLAAAIMKADGRVMRSELSYVKTFMINNFGREAAKAQMLMLKDVLQKDIDIKAVCEQIRHYMDHPSRLQLVHFLFGISRADGNVHESEVTMIGQIASLLGVSKSDYESIRAMFYKDTESAYKILEIDPSSSDDEVKKAYRRMAVKFHPDKVAHLGEEVQLAAQEKFRKVNEAYELIKSKRNMK